MSTPLRFQDLPSDIIYMIREVLQDDFQALRCLWQLDRRCYRITLPKILEKVSSNDLTKLANIVPPENRQMYADLIRMLKVKKYAATGHCPLSSFCTSGQTQNFALSGTAPSLPEVCRSSDATAAHSLSGY
jgi:hypothetical protein